jgi:hypothetical protein
MYIAYIYVRRITMSVDRSIDRALEIMEARSAQFGKVLADLDDLDIDYAIVGGLAVGHHGWDRATKDIDVLINSADLSKITENGRFSIRSDEQDFLFITHVPTGVNVDVLKGGTIFPNLNTISRSSRDHRVASAEDLIMIKTLRGDPSDYGDIYRIAKETEINWVAVRFKVSDKVWERLQLDVIRHL